MNTYKNCLLCGIDTGTHDHLCASCNEKELIRINRAKELKNSTFLPDGIEDLMNLDVYTKMSKLIEYQDRFIISLENELKALRFITDKVINDSWACINKGFTK